MSKIALSGNASGTGVFTFASPNSNTDRTLDIPDASGVVVLDTAAQTLTNKTLGSGLVMGASAVTSATAQASTSGTSIDFTGIPSWVKRITVLFKNVSTNGTSLKQIQLGTSSGVTTSGYQSSCSLIYGNNLCVVDSITSGFLMRSDVAAEELNGHYVFTLIGSNGWVGSTIFQNQGNTRVWQGAGRMDLSGTLDRVRITTVNGTDAFDAGSINIFYE